MDKLRLLDTFSGIGGFSYAAEVLVGGYETVQFVEREPFCQQILLKHWPNVPIHNDIITFEPELGSADVICGGFPCQDISTAGKGAGIKEGTRSGLFFQLMRVVCLVRPQFVVLENVAAIRNRGLDTVLGELAEAGYDCEWACIRASDVGACHQRDRWWLVAYAQGIGRRTGQGQGTRQVGYQISGAGDHDPGSDAADTNSQRQQEQQSPAITSREGRISWGDAPQRLSSDWRSYLSEPVLCRGDDGLSGRVDRLKALGNAVVPQVAAIPLTRVLELAQRQPF